MIYHAFRAEEEFLAGRYYGDFTNKFCQPLVVEKCEQAMWYNLLLAEEHRSNL